MYPRKTIVGALLLSVLTNGCALYDGFSDQAQWSTPNQTPDSSSSDMREPAEMTPDKDMPDQALNIDMGDMGDLGLPPDDMANDMADMPDMTTPPDPDTVKQISTGSAFTCALYHGGYVKCWGQYDLGQLGYEPASNPPSWQPSAKVTGLDDAAQLSSGYEHTCAITSTGDVYCWGDNAKGQLGEVPYKDPNDPEVWIVPPTSATPRKVEFATPQKIVQVSGGAEHTCATNDAGEVYCWGSNSWGQRGSSGASGMGTPKLADLIDAAQVATGQLFSCALKRDQRVMCWGYNYHGELGRDTQQLINPAPGFATDISKADKLWVGTRYGCITRDDGQQGKELACWGWFPTRANLNDMPQPTLVAVDNIGDAQSLATTDRHICALRADGAVYCWGRNGEYLGRGPSPDAPETPQSTLLKDIIQVSATNTHTCALNQKRQVFCWGNNGQGQLGNSTLATDLRPGLVENL